MNATHGTQRQPTEAKVEALYNLAPWPNDDCVQSLRLAIGSSRLVEPRRVDHSATARDKGGVVDGYHVTRLRLHAFAAFMQHLDMQLSCRRREGRTRSAHPRGRPRHRAWLRDCGYERACSSSAGRRWRVSMVSPVAAAGCT